MISKLVPDLSGNSLTTNTRSIPVYLSNVNGRDARLMTDILLVHLLMQQRYSHATTRRRNENQMQFKLNRYVHYERK